MAIAIRVEDVLRDELTQERLLAAVMHLPGLQVLDYVHDWWDGQSYVPCLVIRGGRRCRRLRVVETAGECVVVPFSRRVAQRWLAARRRPRRPELDVPRPRDGNAPLHWEVGPDVVRCTRRACGVLVPIGYDGDCPVCGDVEPA